MNGSVGDGDVCEKNSDNPPDATSETSSNAKQVEEVLKSLIETTDNSISNSWTILSTDDENTSEGEAVKTETNVNAAAPTEHLQNNNSLNVHQVLDTNHCLHSNDEKIQSESWLQIDHKDAPTLETAAQQDEDSMSIPQTDQVSSEAVTVAYNKLTETECKNINAGSEGLLNDVDTEASSKNPEESISLEPESLKDKNVEYPSTVEPESLKDEKVESPTVEPESLKDEKVESPTVEPESLKDKKVEQCNIDNQDENEEKSNEVVNEWLDILGNQLLMKKVMKKGLGPDHRAQRGQECHIYLQASLSDGTPIDERHKEVFILGDKDLTSAIDLSTNLMEKGEICKVNSDSKYCYGEEGRLPKIPPNSNIQYDIELIDLQNGPYDPETAVEKRLAWVDSKRNKGNQLYREKKFEDAISAYTKCARVIEQASHQVQPDEIRTQINQLNIKCQNNLSAAYMMMERWKDALKACNTVTTIDPKNIRALFRKGKALAETGELKSAVMHLKKAAKLSPNDKTIQSEITKQSNRLKTQKEEQKKMYQRMFGGPAVTSKNNEGSKEDAGSWLPSATTSVVVGVCAIAVFAIAGYFTAR